MSFSAEMKDFLGGWGAVSKIGSQRTSQDLQKEQIDSAKYQNSPEYRAAEDRTEELNQKMQEQNILNAGSTRGLHAAQADWYRNKGANPTPAVDPNSVYPGQTGVGGGGGPVLNEAAGGLIPRKKYDDGGAVPEGYSSAGYAGGGDVPTAAPAANNDDDDEDTSATPAVGGANIPSNATPTSGTGLTPELYKAGMSAAVDGMRHNVNAHGLSTGGLRTTAQKRAAAAYQQGAGALSPQEMEAARKAVDPDGTKYTESQRNMAALGTVWQFFKNKGQDDKAGKVAGEMMQAYRGATDRYAALAAHAANGGNLGDAAKYMARSYANIPDGKDMELMVDPDNPGHLQAAYTGPDGNQIFKGLMTPKDMVDASMGLASGGFDKMMMRTAAENEAAAGGKGKAAAGPKPSDDIAIHKLFNDPTEGVIPQMSKQVTDADPKLSGDKPDPALLAQHQATMGDISDLGQHLYRSNIGKVTPREAAIYSARLLTPGKADPEKSDFKVVPGEDGKPTTITFGDKRQITLDDNEFNKAMDIRAAKVKAATDKINADMEAQDQPGFGAKASKNIGDIIEGAKGVRDSIRSDLAKRAAEDARRPAPLPQSQGAVPDDAYNNASP